MDKKSQSGILLLLFIVVITKVEAWITQGRINERAHSRAQLPKAEDTVCTSVGSGSAVIESSWRSLISSSSVVVSMTVG